MQKKRPCEDGDRGWSNVTRSQGMPRIIWTHQHLRERFRVDPPPRLQKKPTTMTSRLWTSCLQACDGRHSYRPTPLSLWQFVTAPPGRDTRASVVLAGLPPRLSSKEPSCNAKAAGDLVSIPVGKIPWGRKWQPTPVFWPREFHRQSLAGYSPRGCRVRHDWLSWAVWCWEVCYNCLCFIFLFFFFFLVFYKMQLIVKLIPQGLFWGIALKKLIHGNFMINRNHSISICSFAKSCWTLCDPMDCNTPGSSVLHYLLEIESWEVVFKTGPLRAS